MHLTKIISHKEGSIERRLHITVEYSRDENVELYSLVAFEDRNYGSFIESSCKAIDLTDVAYRLPGFEEMLNKIDWQEVYHEHRHEARHAEV